MVTQSVCFTLILPGVNNITLLNVRYFNVLLLIPHLFSYLFFEFFIKITIVSDCVDILKKLRTVLVY